MKRHINDFTGSVGRILCNHCEEVSRIKNEFDLNKFMSGVVSKEIEPQYEQDYKDMVEYMGGLRGFNCKYRFLYNYILAGDGLRVN